jgi:hypothetical protein
MRTCIHTCSQRQLVLAILTALVAVTGSKADIDRERYDPIYREEMERYRRAMDRI